MEPHRTARCCCGTVSVAVHGEPALHALCHCANCKQRTGSAFGISTYFPRSQIDSIAGEVIEYSVVTQHNEQVRHFCKTCGTTVYWYVSTMPDLIGIAGGCFAETPLGVPDATVFDDQRCTWIELPKGLAKSLSELAEQ